MPGVTSLSIRSLQGALGGPECYFQDVPIAARFGKGRGQPSKPLASSRDEKTPTFLLSMFITGLGWVFIARVYKQPYIDIGLKDYDSCSLEGAVTSVIWFSFWIFSGAFLDARANVGSHPTMG